MRNFSLSTALILAFAVVAAAQAPEKASSKTGTKAGAKAPAKAHGTAARTVTITGTEQMKYDVATIQAKPGEQIHVVLKSVGTMPKIAMAHNFVLLKADASPLDVGNAAMMARDTDFIPASMQDKIIAHTGLAGGGETTDVTFKAPTKRGTYPYMCTFPGHFAAGMKGDFVVK